MDEATTFFETLFDGKDNAEKIVVWSPSTAPRATFHTGPKEAARNAAERGRRHDIYFGVGLLKAAPATGRGRKGDISRVTCLWADIDLTAKPGKRPCPNRAVAEKFLNEIGRKPTILVNSGHGLHAYWCLAEHLTCKTAEGLQKTEAILARWQATLDAVAAKFGFDLDHVHDVTRVMRVPGTFNQKDGQPAAVKLLQCEALYYPLDDMLDVMVEAPSSQQQPKEAGEPTFTIKRDAQPPGDKFFRLCENDPRFHDTWNRKRSDLKDKSTSGYEMALAHAMQEANWSDQEIVDTLIAFRRQQCGEGPKHEQYYRLTLHRSRVEHAAQQAEDEIEHINITAGGEPQPPKDDAQRRQWLGLINQALQLNVHIIRWIQHGRENARYTAVLSNGKTVPIGNVDAVLNQSRFRARIYEETNETVRIMKQQTWLNVARLLGRVAEIDEDENRLLDQFACYIADYATAHPPADDDRWQDAALHGQPFRRDGKLCISIPSLRRYIYAQYDENYSSTDMVWHLKRLGFERQVVGIRIKETTTTRAVWGCRTDDLHVPLMGEKFFERTQ